MKDGKLKALVVGGTSRQKVLPNTPVFGETTIAPIRADFLWSLVAPAGTPLEVRERIPASVKRALEDPKFQETQLDPYGYVRVGSTPAEFERFLARLASPYTQPCAATTHSWRFSSPTG